MENNFGGGKKGVLLVLPRVVGKREKYFSPKLTDYFIHRWERWLFSLNPERTPDVFHVDDVKMTQICFANALYFRKNTDQYPHVTVNRSAKTFP